MESSAEDNALNEALSMLDSFNADGETNAGFAIDSDDDDENFNLDDELNQLEGIDLTTTTNNNTANNGKLKEEAAGGGLLQPVENSNKMMNDPPSQQDVADRNINVTNDVTNASPSLAAAPSSSSSANVSGANNNDDNSPPLFHPLQDVGRAPPPHNTNNNTVMSTTADASHRSSSWTSSFASFAKVASASIQSAVESAEATLIHQGSLFREVVAVVVGLGDDCIIIF